MACKLFFAGDVVLGENCFEKKLLNKDFYNVIQDCDIICCNLEAPLKGENGKATKKIGPNNFNVEDVIPSLRESGFNLVTLANNHIFDFGICGINKTLEVLAYNNVDYIGAGVTFDSIYKPYIKNCNGIKVCIINAAENGFGAAVDGQTYGYAYIYNKSVENMIREYRSNCDLLIMICHAGMEGWNIPLPEWRDLYKHFIDIGTDIVIAHHPHVAQGWENYNGGHIFYSLGNFAFNKRNKILNNRGLGVIIEYDENKNLTYKVIPTKFENKQVLLNDDIDYKTELNKDCLILEDIDSYMQAINEKCIQAYNSIYKKAYFRVACKYKGGLMERIKGIVKSIFIQDGFQDIWLYHNLVIETHYYVCKRAVALSLKKKKII